MISINSSVLFHTCPTVLTDFNQQKLRLSNALKEIVMFDLSREEVQKKSAKMGKATWGGERLV